MSGAEHRARQQVGAEHGARQLSDEDLVDIANAARIVGLLETTFLETYIQSGRVTPSATRAYSSRRRETFTREPLFRVGDLIGRPRTMGEASADRAAAENS